MYKEWVPVESAEGKEIGTIGIIGQSLRLDESSDNQLNQFFFYQIKAILLKFQQKYNRDLQVLSLNPVKCISRYSYLIWYYA